MAGSLDPSPCIAVALLPIAATALSSSAWRRPVMKTRAPSLAKRLAVPRPMPALPPVTTAILPSSFLVMAISFRVGELAAGVRPPAVRSILLRSGGSASGQPVGYGQQFGWVGPARVIWVHL